jgi:hypothetical protein
MWASVLWLIAKWLYKHVFEMFHIVFNLYLTGKRSSLLLLLSAGSSKGWSTVSYVCTGGTLEPVVVGYISLLNSYTDFVVILCTNLWVQYGEWVICFIQIKSHIVIITLPSITINKILGVHFKNLVILWLLLGKLQKVLIGSRLQGGNTLFFFKWLRWQYLFKLGNI